MSRRQREVAGAGPGNRSESEAQKRIDCNKLERSGRSLAPPPPLLAMSSAIGAANAHTSPNPGQRRGPLQAAKKKGCKQKKCSNWKGGKCRCGRD